MNNYPQAAGATVQNKNKCGSNGDSASAPFLQGVKVKALEWTKGVVDIAHPPPGMKYVACSTTPKGSWAWWLDNAPETRDVFSSEEAAKAAAQSAYEARILSALEPFANSYPQGANLAAHSKNENGPDHEPSPRAQALEEIISELKEAERKIFSWSGSAFVANELEGAEDADCKSEIYNDLCKLGNVMYWLQTQIIALSSQPVADGWLPTHRHKKRGTEYRVIGTAQVQCSDGLTDYEVVTVYVDEDNQMWVRRISEFEDGRFEALPASPGASSTRPTGGSNHGE